MKNADKLWLVIATMLIFAMTGCREPYNKRSLTYISITSYPAKTNYNAGDNLDISDMVITAIYNDKSISAVNGYTTNPAAGAALEVSHTRVTVSYTEDDVTKTASFAITVVQSAPANVTAEAVSSESIIVRWSSVPNVNSYHVFRSTGPSGTFDNIGTSNSTSYTDNETSPNTTYYYRVAAYTNSGLAIDESNTASATTPPSAPGGDTGGDPPDDKNDDVWSEMTWTAVINSPFPNGSFDNISAVAYGGGKFVAGGSDGRMAISSDGITWTAVNSTFGTNQILGITYGDGLFVAVGAGRRLATSPCGETWTPIDVFNAAGTNGLGCITYGGGRFVASTFVGTVIISADGISWVRAQSGYGSIFGIYYTGIISRIAYGNGRFIAVGINGRMAASPDGNVWTEIANTSFPSTEWGNIHSITYGGGMFVAGGAARMATSPDGETWTQVADSAYRNYGVRGITYGNGTFVAAGGGGYAKIETSSDGINWFPVKDTVLLIDRNGSILKAAYGGSVDRFVVVGSFGCIAYSN